MKKDLVVILPCKNEADNLHIVVKKLKDLQPAAIIVAVDPGTTDNTMSVAKNLGCITVSPNRSGYDPVVNEATKYALSNYKDSMLFYSDAGDRYEYTKVPQMIAMLDDGYDMVMGVRVDSNNHMLWHQKLGTQIVLKFINLLTRNKLQDISPFRLVKSSVFDVVKMSPKKYRWPSELLVKSLASGLKVGQTDIATRHRIGESKVSGSLKNSLKAGIEMFTSLQFYNYRTESKYVLEKR
jgi:glycosyltransferase involved in cell wall biosynthesis